MMITSSSNRCHMRSFNDSRSHLCQLDYSQWRRIRFCWWLRTLPILLTSIMEKAQQRRRTSTLIYWLNRSMPKPIPSICFPAFISLRWISRVCMRWQSPQGRFPKSHWEIWRFVPSEWPSMESRKKSQWESHWTIWPRPPYSRQTSRDQWSKAPRKTITTLSSSFHSSDASSPRCLATSATTSNIES